MTGRFISRLLVFLLTGVFAALDAHASNHITKIDEVMTGAYGRKDIQFVEITFECGQNHWQNLARLAFFDAADNRVGEYVFPSDPPDPCTAGGSSALIATQAFADLELTPAPDFIMPAGLIADSGKVCFEGVAESGGVEVNLCLTYGEFTGDSQQSSPRNAPALPATGICALQRGFTGFFGEPSNNDDFLLSPPAPRNTAGETGDLTVPPRFGDVPAESPFFPFVEALFNAGVTGGCGGGAYCPGNLVTREQMAVFLLRAREGAAYLPPACTAQIFGDVPCSSPFAPWINELAARGITGGCGNGNYCPERAVTREQMAVFLMMAHPDSGGTAALQCTAQVFGDVPCSSPFAPWINELAARGITGGCGGGNYCPGIPVTRDQMAVFVSSAFRLPVPYPGCPPLPAFDDDHGDKPESATLLTVDATPVPGAIQIGRDVDYFAFTAAPGQRLLIQTSKLGTGSDTLLRLFAPDGTTLLAADDNGAGGLASRILFTAAETGPYFVAVTHRSSSGTGTYEIGVRRVVDDHGDSATQATPLTVGGTPVAGNNEIAGDVDFFSFTAGDGQTLAIRTSDLGTGSDTFLRLYDRDGATQLSFDDDSGGGSASRIL
ncbi:MAG TPA: S-layer homology domain-containing protein, partial [Thermoanaerobaculia bacterium]|nr:S-layer homology domain-containing protein [Thermoanaerobaculia bacterium]